MLDNFAVLKYEKAREKRVLFGGFVEGSQLGALVVKSVEKPTVSIVASLPLTSDWEISTKRDIRREFACTCLFEGRVTAVEYNRIRFNEEDEVTTYNTQLDFTHLALIQNNHSVSSAAWSILAIDIEASGVDGFPSSDLDPILQISCSFQPRNKDVTHASGCVLSLNGAGGVYAKDSEDSEDSKDSKDAGDVTINEDFLYEEFETERGLLVRFVQMVRSFDPDFITGWNVLNFDLDYIVTRAKHLNVRLGLGRDGSQPKTYTKESNSRAHGTRVTKMCDVYGRIVFDSLNAFQKILNEPSYKLQSIAMKYLGTGKDDMPYSEILPSMLTQSGRLRVARYCYKDSYLVLRILQNRKLILRYSGISKATSAPLWKVIHGGQQIRCLSAFIQEIYSSDLAFAFPNVSLDESRGYQGATVLTPRKGATDGCMACLDFASLYPSIIIAYNICFSTLTTCAEPVVPYDVGDTCPYQKLEYIEGVGNVRRAVSIVDGQVVDHRRTAFVQDTPGLLPRVLKKLRTLRNDVKRNMKEDGITTLDYDILDSYQQALKLVMNSSYGFLGAKKGYLPEVKLAEAITSQGRMLIEWTRICVELQGLEVWGGDTDSVFVHTPRDTCETPAEFHKFWDVLAQGLTKTYGHPALNLEYEKMYYGKPGCISWVLVAKKRYAGYKWDAWVNAAKAKVVYTGLECKRRDFCAHLQTTMVELLQNLFTVGVDDAFARLFDKIKFIFEHHSEQTSGFVLSKQYFKKAEAYANPLAMPHVQIAERTKANVGSRIHYLIQEHAVGHRASSLSDRAVSVSEFEVMGATIDITFYFTKQFEKPLRRITDVVHRVNSDRLWVELRKCIRTTGSKRKRIRDKQAFNKLFSL